VQNSVARFSNLTQIGQLFRSSNACQNRVGAESVLETGPVIATFELRISMTQLRVALASVWGIYRPPLVTFMATIWSHWFRTEFVFLFLRPPACFCSHGCDAQWWIFREKMPFHLRSEWNSAKIRTL